MSGQVQLDFSARPRVVNDRPVLAGSTDAPTAHAAAADLIASGRLSQRCREALALLGLPRTHGGELRELAPAAGLKPEHEHGPRAFAIAGRTDQQRIADDGNAPLRGRSKPLR